MFDANSKAFQIIDNEGQVIKISEPSKISSSYIEIDGIFFSKKTGYKLSKIPNFFSTFKYDAYSNNIKIFDVASHIENFDENKLQSLDFYNQNISFEEIFCDSKNLTVDQFTSSIKESLDAYNIPSYATIDSISHSSICFSFTRKEDYNEYYNREYFDVRTKLTELKLEENKLSLIIENSKNDLEKIKKLIKKIKNS